MAIRLGEKLFIVERRHFQEDVRRHFVGEVVAISNEMLRLRGFVWVYDGYAKFVRKQEVRERIIANIDSYLVINIIPVQTDIEAVHYIQDANVGLVVTDGKTFKLDISEFGAMR